MYFMYRTQMPLVFQQWIPSAYTHIFYVSAQVREYFVSGQGLVVQAPALISYADR